MYQTFNADKPVGNNVQANMQSIINFLSQNKTMLQSFADKEMIL